MLKILIISPRQKGIGGIAQHVQGQANFLKQKGHEVDVISSENTFTIPIKRLKNPSFMISAFFKTKLKKGNDIVHAHNLPSALPMKHASGKKVLTIHGIYSEQIELLHGKVMGNLSSTYEKDALTWADAITVISKEAYDHYTKLGFKVHYIPNAINISSLPQQKDKRFEKQIIFAGRLSKEKGILNLLEISKSLPTDVHILIAGSGPEEDRVKEVAKTQSNLHFLGYQTKEKTIALIRGSDVLVQPSLMEGLSSTILEAMACKIPIVATNVGGNKEILDNNKTGILVRLNSNDEILNEILDLLSNKKKSNQLVENAFREVQRYDWSNIGSLYLKLYEELIEHA